MKNLLENKTHDDTKIKPFVVLVELEFKGKTYSFDYDFGEYSIQGAEFMFTEGNYSCDCNKSQFIREHCDPKFPEFPCSDEIKLTGLFLKP